MFINKHKVIGILGGMGPAATMDLYNQILRFTKVNAEQDHLSTLIFSNPKIPDRSLSFSEENNVEIVRYLCETAIILEQGGADVLALPCNSAHIYYDEIKNAVNVPLINIIEETVSYVVSHLDCENGLALLGTTATYSAALYQKCLDFHGVSLHLPELVDRKSVMQAIYAIKLDANLYAAKQALLSVINQWDVPVILGCSEISMVLAGCDTHQFINPIEILAKSAILAVDPTALHV